MKPVCSNLEIGKVMTSLLINHYYSIWMFGEIMCFQDHRWAANKQLFFKKNNFVKTEKEGLQGWGPLVHQNQGRNKTRISTHQIITAIRTKFY